MTLYLDSSALLKRYLSEADSDACERILLADPEWLTARHSSIEVRRALVRDLEGADLAVARGNFARDWELMGLIDLDATVCERAAEVAEVTGVRTLDALHLAAAQRIRTESSSFVTYDLRQAQAARSLGWSVLGV